MFRFDHRSARPVTSELIDLAEGGMIDWETLARDCLGWMSEHDVAQMAQRLDYVTEEEQE